MAISARDTISGHSTKLEVSRIQRVHGGKMVYHLNHFYLSLDSRKYSASHHQQPYRHYIDVHPYSFGSNVLTRLASNENLIAIVRMSTSRVLNDLLVSYLG